MNYIILGFCTQWIVGFESCGYFRERLGMRNLLNTMSCVWIGDGSEWSGEHGALKKRSNAWRLGWGLVGYP